MRNLLASVFMIGLVVLPAAGCNTDTETGGLEQATGGEGGADASPAAPEQVWTFATGGESWSSPVVHDGSIIVGSDDGNIYSVDRATGKQIWIFATGGRVRSSAAVCGGTAFLASDDGNLYALGIDTGAEAWGFDLGSAEISRRLPATEPPYDYDYLTSSPVCAAGTVYAGSADGHLYAVDAAAGSERWRFKTGDQIRSTPLLHEGRVYVGSWDHHVYALDAATGEEVWRFDTGGIVQASPAQGDGKIFIGSRNPKIFALDAAAGTSVWEFVHEDGSWVESSAVFADGTVYIGSSDALVLQALDPATGAERWRYRTGGWSWGTPRVTGDTVYIGAISAHPYYFEGVTLRRGLHAVDRDTGVKRWSIETGALTGGYVTGGVHATPAIADGVIYVAALDGNLYALK